MKTTTPMPLTVSDGIPVATSLATRTVRLDYLEAVRAFALLLGVVFHAGLSFMPMFIGWAVMDISTSQWIPLFTLVSHSFRMELFFLVAGFFSHMVVTRQGLRAFLISRFWRIVVPFVIGWIVLRPLLVSGWIMGAQSMRGDADVGAALLGGIESLSALPQGIFVGTHLWFLYYLLVITAGLLMVRYVVKKSGAPATWLSGLAAATVAFLCRSKLGIIAAAVPTACCLWFMHHWGVDTPDKSLLPHLPVTLIYAGFFTCGWLMQRHTAMIEQFARITGFKLGLCIVATAGAAILSQYEARPAHEQYHYLKAAYMLCYAVMMWSLVALIIGACKKWLSGQSAIVRYLADGAYWLYLIHLPIVVWLQVAFAELPLHWLIKLCSISGLTVATSFALYEVMVRRTVVGRVLNGQRQKDNPGVTLASR
ncbi:acyltransferase family protein [Alteromonas gilva]|uniref:Acyltransferase family protein n=1 Tax=Alteromonas gilva TaxID=2987522 RepID=A0ABT5L7U2_9ALTE|nr:acyltransferase family protein [Alteromonas gilva]MDC8832446.1 acyltransferase family protein [Alteromonas gilva]